MDWLADQQVNNSVEFSEQSGNWKQMVKRYLKIKELNTEYRTEYRTSQTSQIHENY